MSARIYIEGGAAGADSKDVTIRCREGFRKLIENCGFTGRMPRLTACGGRDAAFGDFQIAHLKRYQGDFIALWVDSEEPIANTEATWDHLRKRDGWQMPAGATDDQVLLMTTCMETLFVADREALRAHFKNNLRENALPPLQNLESRGRHEVQGQLAHATRDCSNRYEKGARSFEILGKLTPATLALHLPSFVRVRRILDACL